MDYNEIDNIIHAGVVFIVYLFVMILIYYTLSTPLDAFFDSMQSAPLGDVSDEMDLFVPDISWALKIVFAIGISIPVTWFIFWVFSREPYIGRVRRF